MFVYTPSPLLSCKFSFTPLAIVSSAFDPPDGQEPFSLVFGLTGDIAYDRPDMVRPPLITCMEVCNVTSPTWHIQGPNQSYVYRFAFDRGGSRTPQCEGLRPFTAALVRVSRERLPR
jgi:hypothetical protein